MTMVKAGDREGAHLGMDFLFRVAPFVEGGGAVWLDFADWQEEGGERDLGKLWRVRAEENLLRADQRRYGETRRSNRANFRMYVSFVFLVFLVFIISLRGVLRRREKGNGGLLPEPSLLDGALFLLALVLATVMSGRKGSPNGEGHRRVLIREARAG